ncbi:MAG TPA: thermonuclease family protein [Candidatus Acidoferrum sp.]|nr:thermonuclease family protein [Candidatus Acidoferrum sp.]
MAKRRSLKLLIIVLAMAAGSFVLTSSSQQTPTVTASTPPPGFYRIDHFVDGDTIAVQMSGKAEEVRFIGIDTPETHKPNTPVQCYGPQASDFTARAIGSQPVRLEADPLGDNRDRYGRLLRYIYLPDGTLLNEELVQKGYAFAYISFPFSKKAAFIDDAAKAQTAKLGLWGTCTPTLTGNRWQSNAL